MTAEQRKAVIKNADMSESMQQDAVDVASQALAKYNIEKVRSGDFMQWTTIVTWPWFLSEYCCWVALRGIGAFDSGLALFTRREWFQSGLSDCFGGMGFERDSGSRIPQYSQMPLQFSFLTFSIFHLGCGGLHKAGVRQEVQPNVACYCRKKFRLICHAWDETLYLFLPGTSRYSSLQERLIIKLESTRWFLISRWWVVISMHRFRLASVSACWRYSWKECSNLIVGLLYGC